MKIDNKNKIIIMCLLILIVTLVYFARVSFASSDILTSNTYRIDNNTIYAVPTASNLIGEELLRNLESTDKIELYNSSNTKIEKEEAIKTGYKLKTSNVTFDIVVLGDVTGDGNINLGDVSKLYNAYKKNVTLNGNYLKAGKVTSGSNLALGDVSKLYNFYKGKSPFSYFSDKDISSVKDYINQAKNFRTKNPNSNKIGTNIVDSLNISDKESSDQIIVTSDGKVEAAFLRNGFCYRKHADSENLEIIEGSLCKANVTNFPSNGGQLHISGSKILDKNNHEVLLHGASIPTIISLTAENPTRDGITNLNSLHSLRNWGANAVRLFAAADNHYSPAFIGNEDAFTTQYKKIIDMAIQSDMYIIVNWDPARNDGASYTNEAVDFFTRISSAYPNDPHIIYEIWNEPEDSNNAGWTKVHAHADAVIPVIRQNSPNSVILVGTPGWDYSALYTQGHELSYDNIMYVFHLYMNSCRGYLLERLADQVQAGVPIIVTEWGSMSIDRNTRLVYDELAEASAKMFDKYKISNLLFSFGTSNDYDDPYGNKYGIVLTGKWEDELPNRILKINGKFMKTALSNNYQEFKTNLMRDNKETKESGKARDYRSAEWRDKIVSIEFKTTLSVPSNAVQTWDLSLLQDGSIIGYLLATNTTDRYKMVICANGPINAPSNSDYLFANLSNLESIDFTGFTTKYVDKLNRMFNGDAKLVTLDLSGFDTGLFHELWGTFAGCNSLKSVDMTGWTLTKVSSVGDLFYDCNNIEHIDLSGWEVTKASSFRQMFYHCYKLKTVNLSTWAPTTISTVYRMFMGCSSLETVDMRNMTSDTVPTGNDNVGEALSGVKAGAKFIVNNNIVKGILEPTATNSVIFEIKSGN